MAKVEIKDETLEGIENRVEVSEFETVREYVNFVLEEVLRQVEGDEPEGEIEVMAHVKNHHIMHVVCEKCRQQIEPDLDTVTGDEKPKSERALVDVLGKDPEVRPFGSHPNG